MADRIPNGALRRQLFEAAGIVTVTRYALASNLEGLDEESVIDALSAVAKIIDDVAEALET
jgi:hypothetical protein